MQAANVEVSRVYSEIRDRALAGGEITDEDYERLRFSIGEEDQKVTNAFRLAKEQSGIKNNFFISSLLRARVHRIRSLPYGAPPNSSDSTYQIDLLNYEKSHNPEDLRPPRSFEVSDLYITSDDIAYEERNLKKTLERVILDSDYLLDEKEIKSIVRLGKNISIESYPAFNYEAFMEIIKNAVDAMPNGGKLEITGRKKKDMVVLTISDTGHGMSPETLQKALAGGFTTKPQGSGQGLGLVKSYFEKILPGKFSVQSEERKGTTITITLPLTGKK